MGIIYVVHDLVEDKLYVGQTIKTMAERRARHFQSAARGDGTRLYASMRKHGTANFIFYVVAEWHSKEELNLAEKVWTLLLGTLNPSVGHNHLLGTARLSHIVKAPFTDERRRKMSENRKPWSEKHLLNVIASNKLRAGCKLTDEHKAKCSLALRGRKMPPRTAEYASKLSAAKIGVKHTPESNAKRSSTQKGRPLSAEHRLKLTLANRERAIRERAERA